MSLGFTEPIAIILTLISFMYLSAPPATSSGNCGFSALSQSLVTSRVSEEHRLTEMEKPQITITQPQPTSFVGHLSGFFKAYSAWIRCLGDHGLFIRLWDHEIRLKDEGDTLSKDNIIIMQGSIWNSGLEDYYGNF
jgi:hypothetical protein